MSVARAAVTVVRCTRMRHTRCFPVCLHGMLMASWFTELGPTARESRPRWCPCSLGHSESRASVSSQGRGRSHSAGVCPARVPEVQSSSRPRRPLSAPLVRGGRAAVSLVFSAPDRAHVPLGGGKELALHDACECVRSLKRPDAAGLWYVYSAFSMEAADLYSRRIFHCSFNKMRKYLL